MRRKGELMTRTERKETIQEIAELIKNLKITVEDFRGKTGGKTKVHELVIETIAEKWQREKGMFLPKYGERIDFVGREKDPRHGKIALAIEVDRWYRAIASWTKLADIRAENKIWLFVSKDKKAKIFFNRAMKEINRLLKFRNEDKSTFGKFALMLKTPTDFEMKWIFEAKE